MLHDSENTLFTLAADFIRFTNRSVFLTGRAGTGKTTFLKYIRQNISKQTAVVAPTGVAAINAGGVTIHSFFQLPFAPFIPVFKGFTDNKDAVDSHQLLSRIRMNRDRRKVLEQLELLIIDEISMVRCDVLDAIDLILRHFRKRNTEPFGGVQLLFIGDMFQLPPVVQDDEWQLLSPHYNSPFFFDSLVLQQEEPVHIELNKIYRQNEQRFIDLLNKVRNNEMDEDGYELLNSRYKPDFVAPVEKRYITLTTHNNKADQINQAALNNLQAKSAEYRAVITGDFSEKNYPAEELLRLKEGAQVMMLKNDAEKRFFNGKIGVITKLEDASIFVQCEGEPDAIEILREKWENIRYTLNNNTQQLDEDTIGTFEQFPLRLAWAITIHKSQGLTFDKAVIDAGAAFAPGQVYVALSRCTTLEGIVLKSQITNNGLKNDPRIVRFASQKHKAPQLSGSLIESKKTYQAQLLLSLFNFDSIVDSAEYLINFVTEHHKDYNDAAITWLQQLQDKTIELHEVCLKFNMQLQQLLQSNLLPEQDTTLQARVEAASNYFTEQLQQLQDYLLTSATITDSKQKAMLYNDFLREVHVAVSQKAFNIRLCKHGFNAEHFEEQKKKFVVLPFRINSYATANKEAKVNIPNPQLYQLLKLLRDKLCQQKNVPVYLVASGATLEEICRYLPQTKEELEQINGFGKAKIDQYGNAFLEVIHEYSSERNLQSLMHEKTSAKKKKTTTTEPKEKINTKQLSYDLYLQGKNIAGIAAERNMAISTIEGHLAHFVQEGKIKIEDLVSKEKILLIEPLLQQENNNSIGNVKSALGDAVSFGDIRLVIASLKHLSSEE